MVIKVLLVMVTLVGKFVAVVGMLISLVLVPMAFVKVVPVRVEGDGAVMRVAVVNGVVLLRIVLSWMQS